MFRSLLRPFRPHDENTQTSYGYTFQWTKHHWSSADLEPLKQAGDPLADAAFERINAICPQTPSAIAKDTKSTSKQQSTDAVAEVEAVVPGKPKTAPTAQRDLYAILRDHRGTEPALAALWDEVHTPPDWVDWAQIRRGQEMFWRYVEPAMVGFAMQGLLAGNGGAERMAETLIRTGGHSVKVARHRFLETAQQLLEVTRDLEAIQPGGAGFVSTVRVRLLHAAVRARITKLAAQRPGYYDAARFGVPINQADTIKTLCTFSTNIVWMGLPAQGVWARGGEIDDYLALFRWVGHVIGAPHRFLHSQARARAMMESILLDAMRPSRNSRILAHNIVASLTHNPPAYASADYWYAGARWINGPELADAMGLPEPSRWTAYLVYVAQSVLFMALCYAGRVVPAINRAKVRLYPALFWSYIVEGKDGMQGRSDFAYKYVPALDQTTPAENQLVKDPKRRMGIERAMYLLLIVEILVLGGVACSVYYAMAALMRFLPLRLGV